VQHAKVEVRFASEEFARELRLGFALSIEVDVVPAGKEVELVPN
jgi:hypothetical protein